MIVPITTAGEWIRSLSPEGQFLDREMDAFRSSHANDGDFSITRIESPSGIQRYVTKRFAAWFLPRNSDWTEVSLEN